MEIEASNEYLPSLKAVYGRVRGAFYSREVESSSYHVVGLTRIASIDSRKESDPDLLLRLDLNATPFKPFIPRQCGQVS